MKIASIALATLFAATAVTADDKGWQSTTWDAKIDNTNTVKGTYKQRYFYNYDSFDAAKGP